jgi:hypothetical protein
VCLITSSINVEEYFDLSIEDFYSKIALALLYNLSFKATITY